MALNEMEAPLGFRAVADDRPGRCRNCAFFVERNTTCTVEDSNGTCNGFSRKDQCHVYFIQLEPVKGCPKAAWALLK